MGFKRAVVLLVVLVIIISFGGYSQALTKYEFSDLPDSHWAYSAVSDLVEMGIISGYPDDTFRPLNKLKRSEFATILSALTSEIIQSPQVNTYEDVTNEHWAYKYIETVGYCFAPFPNRYGIKPLFKPNEYVRREDAAYAMVKMMGLDKMPNGLDKDVNTSILDVMFSDVDSISYNLQKYVAIAVEKKLMVGSNGAFDGQGILTRAQVSALIHNAITKIPGSKGESLSINPKYLNPLIIGDTYKLRGILINQEGTKDVSEEAFWESSSPTIVSVSSSGMITAIDIGEAIIKVKRGTLNASILITVSTGAPKLIEIEPKTITIDPAESYKLRVYVTNSSGSRIDSTNSQTMKITWKSSNPKVAVVDSSSQLIGISPGKTTISAYLNDFPTKVGICEVVVTGEVTSTTNMPPFSQGGSGNPATSTVSNPYTTLPSGVVVIEIGERSNGIDLFVSNTIFVRESSGIGHAFLPDREAPSNKKVVAIIYPKGSVRQEFKINGNDWVAYTGAFEIYANCYISTQAIMGDGSVITGGAEVNSIIK